MGPRKKKERPPKPKKIGSCLACKRIVYDIGTDSPKRPKRPGRKYGIGVIHDDCHATQRREIERWNAAARHK